MEHPNTNPPYLNNALSAFSPLPVTAFEREVVLTTTPGEPVKYTIRAYPNQKLDIHLDHPPLHGSIEFVADRTFLYQPTPFFNGIDTFSCSLHTGAGDVIAIPFSIRVNFSFKQEVILVKANETRKETLTPIPLFRTEIGTKLVEDIPLHEENRKPYTVSLKKKPLHGSVEVYPDGTFEYTPLPAFMGNDTFQVSQHFANAMTNQIDIDVIVEKQVVKEPVATKPAVKKSGKNRATRPKTREQKRPTGKGLTKKRPPK